MGNYQSRDNGIPQIRSYSGRRARSGGLGRTLAWTVLLGSVGLLVVALAVPLIAPRLAGLPPRAIIALYAPEPVQNILLHRPDAQAVLPTAMPDAGAAEALLQEIAPTATPLPPAEVAVAAPSSAGSAPAFVQPTTAALVPTLTVTPAFVPEAANRAERDADPADLAAASFLLTGFTHTYQNFNNCGPATITTALTYYDPSFTQDKAAAFLKPNTLDGNVRPEEIAAYARSVGYDATYRINGDMQLLKRLISSGYPVMIEKGFDPEPDRLGWMGHYLLLTGYSDEDQSFVTEDSYLGPNRSISYGDLDHFWQHFNRTYLVVHRPDQTAAVASIIGDNMNDLTMYTNALYSAQAEINLNSNDAFAWFNLGSSLTGLGRYQQAATAYDEARRVGLPWRMYWYQFGAYESYYRTGRYEDVLTLANATLDNYPELEESYYYRGMVYVARGQLEAAQREFERALGKNPHYAAAQQQLDLVNAQLG